MAGGYSRQRKASASTSSSSCFSIFNIFKTCCSSGDYDDLMSDDGYYVRRNCISDEDGRTFSIADPTINRRATYYIDRFHENRL